MGDTQADRRVRVLIADDHPVFREGLRNVVQVEGRFEVVAQAASGDAAVLEARRCQPDVMLVDVNMPTLDGLQATRVVRAELPATRVILLTAFHDEEQMIRAFRMGASAYFPRMIRASLLEAVDQVLAGRYVVMGQVLSLEDLRRWMATRLHAAAPLGSQRGRLPAADVARNAGPARLAEGASNKDRPPTISERR